MNDAYRGGVIVVALAALYYASRLAVVYLVHRDRRHHVVLHVACLVPALIITTVLTITASVTDTGYDKPLIWRDGARLAQALLAAAGLRPLWDHHRTRHRQEPA